MVAKSKAEIVAVVLVPIVSVSRLSPEPRNLRSRNDYWPVSSPMRENQHNVKLPSPCRPCVLDATKDGNRQLVRILFLTFEPRNVFLASHSQGIDRVRGGRGENWVRSAVSHFALVRAQKPARTL